MAELLDLSVDLGRGLRLRSPVMVASGTFGYGFDAPLVDRTALGAIVTKGTTPTARDGNAPTRIAETASGLLNAIGLQNPGVDQVARLYAPVWAQWDVPVIVNVAGDAVEDYIAVARRLDSTAGVAGMELNISCPNVANGLQFGLDPRMAAHVTASVRAVTRLPLLVKLTPNVTDIVAVGRAVEDAGADGVSAINTYVGMAIDVHRRRPVLSGESGGLSGPAIKPLALHAVWQLAAALSIPVVGIGGIMTAADALEFLLAGAAAVQLGTVNYVRPQAVREIRDGIAAYLEEHDLRALGALPIRPVRVEAHV
ncbi:MAG: dihydroorotate dehydrogenase [Chloroflexi bacterium]|nr:MAG: dihydroorotate dehydrogenase [Chloroflexota bacterium]TMD81611.1 MAG: dihydroorotate dehydrogenase [Chloroflexota bacterium]